MEEKRNFENYKNETKKKEKHVRNKVFKLLEIDYKWDGKKENLIDKTEKVLNPQI